MAMTACVDLSSNKVEVFESPSEILNKYLGSRGYAAKILYDNVGPEVDPLGPENYLIFTTGLFTGTAWPTGARVTVTAKSPLTGAYGYANSGGFFGAELRKAGFDALVIKGKSEEPVYILIQDQDIKILPAHNYWGKTTEETDELFKEKYKRSRIACIGPAGENLVKFSSVMIDAGRAAGRCGLGAVMGSKKLKAVVVKGSKKVEFSDEFKKVAVAKAKKIMQNPAAQDYNRWGTPILVNYKNPRGDLPAKNHQEVQVDYVKKVNAQALDKYVKKTSGCYACPIRCSRHSEVETGPYKCVTEGPEYETIDSFGPMVCNDDMEVIIYANKLCDDLGIDTISAGTVIAFAMECHEKGYLDHEELSLNWGDKDTIISLINKIAFREDLGDILAEGVRIASKKIHPDTEKFALHVKGLETPHQEPRTNRGLALGHVTSNRGADHLYGLSTIDQTKNREAADKFFPGAGDEILDVFSQKYKPDLLLLAEHFSAVTDAIGICKFSTLEAYALTPDDIAEGLNAFDERFNFTPESLLEVGERIVNLERMYNYRHGMDRKDDMLPERFLKEPVDVRKEVDGELTDEIYKTNLLVDLDEMLDEYYQKRGWDENGVPTKEKLIELGLEELVEDL